MKKAKRLISLFLSVFMFLSVTAGIEYSAFAETTGSQIAEYAKTFKGCSYKHAAKGPKCFDCSGFVYYVFKHFGFTVPTSTDGYSNASKYGTKITGDANAKLGDIVVWSGHVGIYIGNGKVMNALGTKTGVCETEIATFVNSKRVKNPSHYYLRVKGVYEYITNPSVTVKTPTELKTNSVKLNFTGNNPSKIKIKTVGIQVRKKGTSNWKTKTKTVASGYTNASSLTIGCTVGSGKELNMSLSSGTAYEYRAYAVYNKKNYYSSVKTFTTAVISPSVAVNSVTDIHSNSAKLNFTVKNPSKLSIKTIGVQIRKKGSSEWLSGQETVKAGNVNASSFSFSWNIGSDKALNMTLESGAAYEYKAYIICNGGYYYSSLSTFKTKSAESNAIAAAYKMEDTENDALDEYEELKAPVLEASVNSNGSFRLSWNKIAGAEKYELFIKNADGSYKLMKTTTALSFTTAVAAYGKQYTYKVRAVRTVDSRHSFISDYSSAVNAVNKKILQTPEMKVKVNSDGSFTLSWDKITGADRYQLYIKNPNGSYKLMKTTSAASFKTAVAAYGGTYTYKMKAVNSKKSGIHSYYSASVNAKNTKKLQAPSGLKVAVHNNGSFTVSWNKVSGADKYELYLYNKGTGKYSLLVSTSSNKFTTTVASKGKTYSYKVRAVKNSKSSVTSDFSAVVSKTR
ncbi:MAG: C40 family peptidase [Eubacterium sp.]|nr:C40 family peptidase [Eubacterium sp.]